MCNLYSITTTTEAMQRLRADWEELWLKMGDGA